MLPRNYPNHVKVGRDIDKLIEQFKNPAINCVIWDRGPTELSKRLGKISINTIKRLSFRLRPQEAFTVLKEYLPRSTKLFKADINFIIQKAKAIGLRFDPKIEMRVAPRSGVRNFHNDGSTFRVLIYYRGPGTQFVANEDCILNKWGQRQVNTDPEPEVFEAPHNSVMFLKGEDWCLGIENNSRHPYDKQTLLHRSPEPFEGRILTVIDHDISSVNYGFAKLLNSAKR